MRLLTLFILLFLTTELIAQIKNVDLLLIKEKEKIVVQKKQIRPYQNLNKSNWQKFNPVNLTFSGLMFFYQNVLSTQVNAGCIYSPSCSEFGKKCIKEHGLIKGMFLTADRVQRCNRITALGLDLTKLNKQFKFQDLPKEYGSKH
jgi:putative membrane protein insertion efficiency factor